jgi:hypothetical protein
MRKSNPYISVVVNCDTRNESNQEQGLFNGTVNLDFLTDGVFNKIKFFEGFDIEVILFVDQHNPIPERALAYIHSICDTVVIRKHSHEEKFNDTNYWQALAMARGTYVAHFDGDMAAFTSGTEPIERMINLLETYDYVSYPDRNSPNPDHNSNYDYYWCSTRFFMCKRETLDFTEIRKCLADMDYLYGKYPASVRNPWFEHVIALISKYAGKGVYYPPMDVDHYAIFCWGSYERFTFQRLHQLSYEEVKQFINARGIHYPCNLNA